MKYSNIDKVINRTRLFTKSSKGALIQVKEIEQFNQVNIPLNTFGLPNNMEQYLDYKIEKFITYWDKRKQLDDDLFPSINPWYGIAEHSAFVGGNVDFSNETSWHHQLIHTYKDMDKLSLNENNRYLKLVIEGIKYLKEKSNGRYFVKFRGANGPMDIANVVRGNDIFYDIYEKPKQLKNLMEFCKDAVLFTLKKQSELVDKVDGGIISGFDVWMPSNSVGHISEDASTMISIEHYDEFARPYTEQVTNQFEHVFMHIHAVGAHNIPSIVSINNIDYVEISNDPNSKRAIEVYKQYKNYLKNKTVCVLLTLKEIEENIEFLSNNKTIVWYNATNLEDANKAINLIREVNNE